MQYHVTFYNNQQGNFQSNLAFTMPNLNAASTCVMPVRNNEVIVHSIKETSLTVCWENYMAMNNWTNSSYANYNFTVQLEDVEAKTNYVQKASYNYSQGITSYTIPGLTGGKTYNVQLRQGGNPVATFSVQTPAAKPAPAPVVQKSSLKGPKDFSSEQFRVGLLKQLRETPKPTNLLVVGSFGHGKSSFVNTVMQAFECKEEAVVSGDRTHGTTQLKRYQLADNLNLWDCFGVSKANFDGIVLDRILDGRYSSGKAMEAGISDSDPHLLKTGDSQNKIHNVMFVVAANDLKGNKDLQTQLTDFKTILVRRGYNPVLVLTKIDTVAPEIEDQLAKVFESDKVAEAVKVASELTGFNLARIFPTKNLTNEYGASTITHHVPLMALSKAVSSALYRDNGDEDAELKEDLPESTAVLAAETGRGYIDPDSFDAFLIKNSLEQLKSTFKSLGVDCVEDFVELEEEDLKDAVIPKPKLKRIIKLIKATKEELEK
eukprot:TRINITY_DN198_c0_g1_i1.p1 TRINITY_DN198_c0_g1~~TRINITY_DN198_c0_g1_i1.p1  ORF type:complete len:568 (+),score=137.26 TRINITY_DN198_c0_g1_i1:242-1705(+)